MSNIFNDDQLRGLTAPPLVDDKFCVSTYKQWKTVNKLWPWDMTYDQYRQWLDSTAKLLSDNPFIRADQLRIRLSMLKHWFDAIEQAIKDGREVSEEVIADFNNRA
ncbi:hypothetical protein D3C85_693530 [compost metagenome]